GDVIPADADRVEVAYLVVDEVLDVAHHAQREFGGEDAGVLRLVLLEDVGLHGAAHLGQGVGLDAGVGFRIDQVVAADAEQAQAQAVVALGQLAQVLRALAAFVELVDLLLRRGPAGVVFAQVLLHVLVDGGVHEHRQDHRRGAVDGHRYRGAGRAEVEAGVQLLHVVQGGDVDAGVADLAVDVRARRRVFAVQGDRIERGGQARGGTALAEVMEAPVGALGRAFAGEHAGGVLAAAAVRVDAAGVR